MKELLLGKYQHIKIDGMNDTWYIIDQIEVDGIAIFLLESEQHSFYRRDLIVDEQGNFLFDDECTQGLTPLIPLIRKKLNER